MEYRRAKQAGRLEGRWAALFLALALIAAALGFGFLTEDAAAAAQIAFFLFLVCFVVAAAIRLVRGPL